MTATFPKRDMKKAYNGIYCVDVSDELKKHIPSDVKEKAIFREHVFFNEECPDGSSEKMARLIYQEYWDNAKLVITSRLHAALPCLSAGVPVILAKDKLSYRFAFLSKYIPLYSKEDYTSINWHPKVVDMEVMKEKILKASANRVMEVFNSYSSIFEISEFYEDVDTSHTPYFEAINDAIVYLKENYSQEDEFDYSIWAITQSADMICNYLEDNYPKARLKAVIDRREGIKFHNKLSVHKEWLDTNKGTLCFVCAPAAMPEAKEYFDVIKQEKYFICWTDGLSR
jgi:hypothetical protein